MATGDTSLRQKLVCKFKHIKNNRQTFAITRFSNSPNSKISQHRRTLNKINPKCKQDILNYFKRQEAVRTNKTTKSNPNSILDKEAPARHLGACVTSNYLTPLKTNGQNLKMGDTSLNTSETESIITFKKGATMGNTSNKTDSTVEHGNDSQATQVAQHHDEHAPQSENNLTQPTTSESGEDALTFIPVTAVKNELADMKNKLSKLENGSMEFLFLNLEYKIKVDNLRLLERVNAVSLNTANTKLICDQAKVDNEEMLKSLEVTQATQDQHQVNITTHSHDLQLIHDKITTLEGIVEKQAQEIQLLRQANDDQKALGMKNMIYIHNIVEEEDEKDADTKRIVNNFFVNEMAINRPIEIQKATREGTLKKPDESNSESNDNMRKYPRSILITLTNLGDKGLIFNNITNLKGKKNSFNNTYVITDKLPAGLQEAKRYQNDVVKRIKQMDGERPNHKFKKGKLLVNNKPFNPTITVPKVSEIVSPNDQDQVNATILTPGESIQHDGCVFTALSQEIRNTEDVKIGYVKAKQLYPDALHISNAYILPGTELDAEDYTDDGEHGCGRLILRLMKNWDITCRAIYVVRRYGGCTPGSKEV